MKLFRNISLALLSVLCIYSCEGPEALAYLDLSLAENNVDSASGSVYVKIASDSSWELELEGDDLSWASLSKTSGTGNQNSIILSYSSYSGTGSRTVTVVATAGKTIRRAALTQSAKKADQGGDDGWKPGNVNGGKSATAPFAWLELPETKADDGFDFLWHNAGTGSERNYSLYWDYKNLVAPWVAYPLNSSLIGTGKRTDAWGLDPLLPSGSQPVLSGAYRDGNNGWYARGHQIPSADRLNYASNVQTFYGTNMTPQINDTFNATVWASLEGLVRRWAQSCDTLYVVTGCVTDGSKYYVYDNAGKKVTVPTGYFKAALRYSKSTTVGYSGYMGVAVYMEHKSYPNSIKVKDYAMSIDDLEKKLGYDLFVNLPERVGSATAATIEAEDPQRNNWWW